MAGFQRSSYYDQRWRQSESLIRARRPYLIKNALLGIGISAVAVGIYAYTLKAVGQDEFDDVKVPDTPAASSQGAAQQSTK